MAVDQVDQVSTACLWLSGGGACWWDAWWGEVEEVEKDIWGDLLRSVRFIMV